MRVDEDRQHAPSLVGLDEPHPAHIRGQVIDGAGALDCPLTSLRFAEVHYQVFGFGEHLMPLFERLDVDGPNPSPLFKEFAHEVSTDEATPARDDDHRIHDVAPLPRACTLINLLNEALALARGLHEPG